MLPAQRYHIYDSNGSGFGPPPRVSFQLRLHQELLEDQREYIKASSDSRALVV
jgi:hypothetical protein